MILLLSKSMILFCHVYLENWVVDGDILTIPRKAHAVIVVIQ